MKEYEWELRALPLVRQVLLHDVSEIFFGTVVVDETYLEGRWRNKRKVIRDQGIKWRTGKLETACFRDSLSLWKGVG